MKKTHDINLSYSQLVALLAARQAERAAAITRINAAMAEYDITVSELEYDKAKKVTKAKRVQVAATKKTKPKRKLKSTAAQRAKWNEYAAKRRERALAAKAA